MALALEGAVDLGRDRKPHLAAEHHRVFGRQAVQSDDMAVEALRRHQRRVEHRAGIAVADHSQQVLHRALPARRPAGRSGAAFWTIHDLRRFCESGASTPSLPPARRCRASTKMKRRRQECGFK